jgi:hypothetical protein
MNCTKEKTMFKIEKNVPFVSTPKGEIAGTLHAMEVGDSFVAPKERIGAIRTMGYRVPGAKFKSRAVEGGFRIWRIA